MKLPKHICCTITHNEHKSKYSSVKQYIEENEKLFEDSLSKEDLKICIEKDELWEIRWYPKTPIGFYHVPSYSLERCLEIINEEGHYD